MRLILLHVLACGHDEELRALQREAFGATADDRALGGRWRPAAHPPSLEELRRVRALEALGYTDAVDPPAPRTGVTRRDSRSVPGFNLVLSAHAPEAALMDAAGEVRRTWTFDVATEWPSVAAETADLRQDYLRRARWTADGELYALYQGLAILRFGRDGRVSAAFTENPHHDLELGHGGTVWALARTPRWEDGRALLDDELVVLDADLAVRRRISILAAVRAYPGLAGRLAAAGDPLHANDIELMEAGRVLVSLRELNALIVLDPEREVIERAWTGSFRAQHAPRIAPDGRIVLFDNQPDRGASRVLALDPETGAEQVVYAGSREEPFYSCFSGDLQLLAGGGLLVTETDRGRAFELSAEGDIVWEYRNPHRAGDGDALVAVLSQVSRVDAEVAAAFLGR